MSDLTQFSQQQNAAAGQLSVESLRALLTPNANALHFDLRNGTPLAQIPSSGENFSAGFLPATAADSWGDPAFKKAYGVKYALYAGSMATAISSEALVIAMGQAGFLGMFGAGGCLPDRIERAIHTIQEALPNGPYGFNLINSPFEPAMEEKAAELYLRHGIRLIEASAYLNITKSLARYRAAGLSRNPDGSIAIANRVIAKVSRKEVAKAFLSPAPDDLLNQLTTDGLVTAEQAQLARLVPMADDITVEADSGGHTDNRPLVVILPAIMRLRDAIQAERNYPQPIRVGAAGGIGTPDAVLAAFMLGAAYVALGSVSQGCLEAGASDHTKKLLAQMESTDVTMAPASDMFEMGVKVQVLKRGTMFAMRGLKLYELYQRYDSIEAIPVAEREKIEKTIFKMPLEAVWQECIRFFTQRDPSQIERANRDPRVKMALIFRWYLGLSSRWSAIGEAGREMDYQIWCGPAMGAFNDWARGSRFEAVENRAIADVSLELLQGAAWLYRVRLLQAQGVVLPAALQDYRPA